MREPRVRLVNGKWLCVLCGAELDVPDGKQPKVMLIGRSGKRNVRALVIDGMEIHRCEVPSRNGG